MSETSTFEASLINEHYTQSEDISVRRYVSHKLLEKVAEGSYFVVPKGFDLHFYPPGITREVPHVTWGAIDNFDFVQELGEVVDDFGTIHVAFSCFRNLIETLTLQLDLHQEYINDPVFSQLSPAVVDYQVIDSSYLVRDRDRVFAFVDRNPELVEPLLEARSRCSEYFPGAQCALGVFMDPGEESPEELVISIMIDDESDGVIEKLDEIDSNWWINQSEEVRSKLVIRAELV
jgi:hypothetical protein